MPALHQILLIEDNRDDTELFRMAFARAGLEGSLHCVHNAQEAFAYLDGIGDFRDRNRFPFPHLLLLDLKLPQTNGFEVLRTLRSRPELKALPVITFTGSEDSSDVRRAYEAGANCYLIKPHSFEDLTALAKLLREFWLKFCLVPEPPHQSSRPGPTAHRF